MEIYLSWSTYLTSCAIIALVYYCTLYLKFYRRVLFKLGTKQTPSPNSDESYSSLNPNKSDDLRSNTQQDLFIHSAHDLVDELRALIKQLAVQSTEKETLIRMVSQLLKKYNSLKSTVFYEPIKNMILIECENECNIHLDPDELTMLWDKM